MKEALKTSCPKEQISTPPETFAQNQKNNVSEKKQRILISGSLQIRKLEQSLDK